MREGVAMKKEELRKLILTAKGAVEADVVKMCIRDSYWHHLFWDLMRW